MLFDGIVNESAIFYYIFFFARVTIKEYFATSVLIYGVGLLTAFDQLNNGPFSSGGRVWCHLNYPFIFRRDVLFVFIFRT